MSSAAVSAGLCKRLCCRAVALLGISPHSLPLREETTNTKGPEYAWGPSCIQLFKIKKKIKIKVIPRSWSPPPRLSQQGHPPKLSHLKHKCKRRHWEQLGTAILRAIQFPPSTCPS